MISPLENLSGPGQPLRKEAPDAKEFTGLKHSGLTRLADAENKANSLESRFDLAYNAAHALSLAALRRAGYRSTNRYIVFQALPQRSVSFLRCGVFSRSAMMSAIAENTKATCTSTSVW